MKRTSPMKYILIQITLVVQALCLGLVIGQVGVPYTNIIAIIGVVPIVLIHVFLK